MAAARAWAKGGRPDDIDELAADLARFGAPADVLVLDALESERGIWPDNVPAITAFLAVDGQWRSVPAPFGGFILLGLDYAAVVAGLQMAGISATPEIWADLCVIEAAAKNALNGRK